jgi:hypothetical protein
MSEYADPQIQSANFEQACLPVATEDTIKSYSDHQLAEMAARARLDPMWIDEDTFEPFKILDGYRYNLSVIAPKD